MIPMVEFDAFDSRRYRTVDVRSGYREWVGTYDRTVEDAMDIDLLEALREPPWHTIEDAADLGCGTGRTGTWLRDKGIASIDGVDLTPRCSTSRDRGGSTAVWSRPTCPPPAWGRRTTTL